MKKRPKGKVTDRRRPGRKTLLTLQVQKNIVECLEAGNYQQTAFTLAGVSHSTYYDWLKWGEAANIKAGAGGKLTKEEKLYSDFSDAIKKAIESSIQRNLETIRSAAEGGFESTITEILDPKTGIVIKRIISRTPPQWTASAWLLERCHPEQFSLKGRIDISGSKTINHNVKVNESTKVEITDANAGSILDILASVGVIPWPGEETKH